MLRQLRATIHAEGGCVAVPDSCPCPVCDGPGSRLESISRDALVDYYRCPLCAHVWTVPKEQCEPTTDVTVKVQ